MPHSPIVTREYLIQAHEFWLRQFQALIGDPTTTGVINRDRIASHHECDFGILLEAGQITFSNPLIASIVRDVHASFHGVAALIIDLHDRGARREEIAEYLSFLEQLSSQLKDMLQQARVVGEPAAS